MSPLSEIFYRQVTITDNKSNIYNVFYLYLFTNSDSLFLKEIIEYIRIRNIDDPEDLSTCVDNSKNKRKDGKNKEKDDPKEKQTTHDNGSPKKQC
ncbi:unnamed protein product [Schistosoma curassoni]|nr:unnamed protein product [Schistosoma curassoni]